MAARGGGAGGVVWFRVEQRGSAWHAAAGEPRRFSVSVTDSELLGGGAMGAVYRAELDGRRVAAKTFHALLQRRTYGIDAETADGRRALRTVAEEASTEADMLAAVEHPALVRLLAVAYEDLGGIRVPLWVITEYADGGDLRGLLRRGPLPIARAVHMLAQLLHGLEALHAHGILHLDVKPANLLLVEGEVKIADFGLSRLVRSIGTLTRRQGAAGTPAYFGRPGAAVTTERDTWAALLVFFEALGGGVPPEPLEEKLAWLRRGAAQLPVAAAPLAALAARAADSPRPLAAGAAPPFTVAASLRAALATLAALAAPGSGEAGLRGELAAARRRVAELERERAAAAGGGAGDADRAALQRQIASAPARREFPAAGEEGAPAPPAGGKGAAGATPPPSADGDGKRAPANGRVVVVAQADGHGSAAFRRNPSDAEVVFDIPDGAELAVADGDDDDDEWVRVLFLDMEGVIKWRNTTQILRLVTPNKHAHTQGVYERMVEEKARGNGGTPVWRRSDGEYYVYLAESNRWHVGSKKDTKGGTDFSTIMAYIISNDVAKKGKLPHEIKAWGHTAPKWRDDLDIRFIAEKGMKRR